MSELDSLLPEEHFELNEYFVVNENRQSAPSLNLVIHDPVELPHKDQSLPISAELGYFNFL